ncbi:oligoendopeptidase F [Jeotgalibacillus proteolyticus]|uniref:Oligopeptidase F n=1 Tax=Jeotgalibacillus proteolyticus TaxID=2082395 RepID=A0A2S5GFV8_9BACL|nr:oligoendopeptidase F [Jeotgalibacillus proteolyticus]PPA71848.1 oligoendopeptidase F [Jeotgalibacillus proteolyticus]
MSGPESLPSKRLTRNEIPKENAWDLSPLFPTTEHWSKAADELGTEADRLTRFKGTLQHGKERIYSCLKEYEAVLIKLNHVFLHARLMYSTDGTNAQYQADFSRAATINAKVKGKLSFIKSELSLLSDEELDELSNDHTMREFTSLFREVLSFKPYLLPQETEKVLADLGQVLESPYSIYQRSKMSDMKFDEIKLDNGVTLPNSFSLFESRYEFSANIEIRRKAYASFSKTLTKYSHTLSAVYEAEIQKQVALAKLRGFNSTTEMLLHNQQISSAAYYRQLDVIQNELAPHMRKLARLRKKVLGLDKMTFVDLKAPLHSSSLPPVTFEEAASVVKEGLSILGPEYSSIINDALTQKWIDLGDNIGKSTGAFCASPYGVHPFLLMTWAGTTRNIFTLAHELGHAGHFYLASQNQSFMNSDCSLYFIEFPSTLNELLVSKQILKSSKNDQIKKQVLLQMIGTYYHNFVTHLLEGEMQRRIYSLADEGKAINASLLNGEMKAVLTSFWGDAVEIDNDAAMTWMRQPHYYMGLYPYTYSAGLAASTEVARLIEEEGEQAVEQFLHVLKAGGTKPPLELLKEAGVDMTSAETLKKAVHFVGHLIDELERSFSK